MCVATIANCFAPHTSCSLRNITRLCDAQQCASSHVTFGILNMLVVVRSAPYLYLRIDARNCSWLCTSYLAMIWQLYIHDIASDTALSPYVSTFPLFYTKYHFEADRHSDRDKPYKDNIGQHQSRDKRHNSFMYSRS